MKNELTDLDIRPAGVPWHLREKKPLGTPLHKTIGKEKCKGCDEYFLPKVVMQIFCTRKCGEKYRNDLAAHRKKRTKPKSLSRFHTEKLPCRFEGCSEGAQGAFQLCHKHVPGFKIPRTFKYRTTTFRFKTTEEVLAFFRKHGTL